MGNSLRRQPQGAIYPELKTPVTEDVLQVGLLFAFGIIAFSFIIIIPGIRGFEVLWCNIFNSCICICININTILFAENLGNTQSVYSSLDWYNIACLQLQLLVWRWNMQPSTVQSSHWEERTSANSSRYWTFHWSQRDKHHTIREGLSR